MSSLKVRLSGMLEYIDANGVDGFNDSKIEELERIILECQENAKGIGVSSDFEIADSLYDTIYEMLKIVKPSSGILSEIWEEDGDITDYTELLVKNPMMSIETVKSWGCSALALFIDRMPDEASYFASYKINGHGIRIVFLDGELVSATSRARSSGGRDLTRHMRTLMGDYCDAFAGQGLVEVRGEVCLRLENLPKAREFNPAIKSAFSAVASLIKPSASEDEIRLLDFLAYKVIMDDFQFETKEEEYNYLCDCGFSTPMYFSIESVRRENLKAEMKAVLQAFEDDYGEFGYFCDGVVFEVNNTETFLALGTEGNHNLGNVALKLGVWEQSQYCGIVQKILWEPGKTKLSPVALVAEEVDILECGFDGSIDNYEELGVLTAQGNKVRRVPLYEPKNILILDAYVGEPIYFRYGGEAGVVPCFSDGRLLKEDAVRDILIEG